MKFGNLSDWQSDTALEMDGVPIDIGAGRSITVRRAGGSNRAFLVAYSAVVASCTPKDDVGAKLLEAMPQLFADHVVLGWQGIEAEDGTPAPYSKAAFLQLVSEAPDLWTRIRVQADQRGRFQRENTERDKATLGKSSRGKRNGGATVHA
jgi:hypothetical protein